MQESGHSSAQGPAPPDFHFGYVVICGPPNAGKSTLLNVLLDEPLAIITPKPQTTRRRTLGILTTERFQAVFVDTPGMLAPRFALHEAMMREVEQSMADADLLLYVADVRDPGSAPGLGDVSRRKPVMIVLNKADLLGRLEESLPVIERLQPLFPGAEFCVISALRRSGLTPLHEWFAARLPSGAPLYPPDQLTEHPERFFVAERIREAIFTRYHQEIPYSTEVEIETFREEPGRKDLIEATVFVENDSQKGILIGKGGRAIRDLGQQARRSIEEFLGRPVFLALRVAVLPNWRRDARALRRLGYRTGSGSQ